MDTNTPAKTGADVIAAAYPSRYYGIFASADGNGALARIIDTQNPNLDIRKVPVAEDMLALTETQYVLWSSAFRIPVSNKALQYPDRYYVRYDKTAPEPAPITLWLDAGDTTTVEGLPPASDMVPVAASDWANTDTFRVGTGKAVQDGKVVDYTPPVPLKDQAKAVLATVQDMLVRKYYLVGMSIPDDWVAYQKALQAISSGDDKTSTALPTAPVTTEG